MEEKGGLSDLSRQEFFFSKGLYRQANGLGIQTR
jgi:hypothetical protein